LEDKFLLSTSEMYQSIRRVCAIARYQAGVQRERAKPLMNVKERGLRWFREEVQEKKRKEAREGDKRRGGGTSPKGSMCITILSRIDAYSYETT
jgi:hypothetical protein